MTRLFYILLAGETVSSFGNNLFDIAIAWYLYDLTKSSLLVGIISGAFNLLVLMNLITGFVADRHVKTQLMRRVDVCQMLIMVVAGAIYGQRTITLLPFILILFATRFVGTFFNPAEDTLIPQLVERESLAKANGLNQGCTMVAQMIGMLVGSTLIAWASLADFMWLNAATFGISLLCVSVVHHQHHEVLAMSAASDPQDHWDAGLKYINRTAILRAICTLALIINLALGPIMSLNVIWVRENLHSTSFVYGVMQVALMVGVILGNVAAAALKIPLKRKMILSLTLVSVAVIGMVALPTVAMTFIMRLLIGLGAGTINVAVFTLIQSTTPVSILGRVNGAMLAASNLALPAGMMLGGLISAVIGVSGVFLVGAIFTLLALLGFARVTVPELS
ncbi:MFS transporter [Levilactobacillus mulengensis]|uniref:MFS transporter n=1 Tax=Levilactobacillus mulengensis TaxID=2486025 RepID=UPI0013DE4527|nr:MFS transporter [Levilactobacillus mulengensis]